MSLLLTMFVFALALFLVVKSSTFFVEFAARLAKRFGVSEFIIGLTLVAIGTSLPELTNTVVSSLKGVNAFAFGNIVGSNMANLGLSVGLCVLLMTIVVQPRFYRREVSVLLVSTVVFSIAAWDGAITRAEGAVLIALFVVYLNYVTKVLFDFGRLIDPRELAYFVGYLSKTSLQEKMQEVTGKFKRWNKRALLDLLGVIASCAVLIFSSTILVDKALEMAALFGVASTAVGATIVAIGTTTPELSVSISSVRRGYHHMFLGNIIGSNVANLLLIMGIGAVIHPIGISSTVVYVTIPLLFLGTLLFSWILSRKQTIHRNYGVVMLLLYASFLFLVWNVA